MFYVYIIESLMDGTFYKGFSTDYEKRLREHNDGESQYTSSKRPWKLVYVEIHETKTEALKRERRLKRQNRNYLEWLIQQDSNILKQL